MNRTCRRIACVPLLLAAVALGACEPTVKVEAPREPIHFVFDINLKAEVRVKLEEAAKQDITNNPDVFGG